MLIPFYKYHGTGNDFILIDNINNSCISYPADPNFFKSLCDRKFGIGADGVIFLQPHANYDFEMVYYNPDGSQSLCGNGSRCAVHLASQLGIIPYKATFLAIDGPHQAYIQDENIQLTMQDVTDIQSIGEDYFLNTGSPHYIRLVKDLEEIDIIYIAEAINNSAPFKNSRTNVNFVKLEENNHISVRTYERGVNNETLSCGTGAVAAALVAAEKGYVSPIHVCTRGGKLSISFHKKKNKYNNICLIGPATQVFQGQICV